MGTSKPRPRCPSCQCCLFEQRPNPLDAEKERIPIPPTITEADESYAVEYEPDVGPREALKMLLDVTHNAVVRQGWIH